MQCNLDHISLLIGSELLTGDLLWFIVDTGTCFRHPLAAAAHTITAVYALLSARDHSSVCLTLEQR